MSEFTTKYDIETLIFEFLEKHGGKKTPIRVQSKKEMLNLALLLRKLGYFLPEGKDLYHDLKPVKGGFKHRFKLFNPQIATFGPISFGENTVTYSSLSEFLTKKLGYIPKIRDEVWNEGYGKGRVTEVNNGILTVKFLKLNYKINVTPKDVVKVNKQRGVQLIRRNILADYWFILGNKVFRTIDARMEEDDLRFYENNYFYTKEDAEKVLEYRHLNFNNGGCDSIKFINSFYHYVLQEDTENVLNVSCDIEDDAFWEQFKKEEEEGS